VVKVNTNVVSKVKKVNLLV